MKTFFHALAHLLAILTALLVLLNQIEPLDGVWSMAVAIYLFVSNP